MTALKTILTAKGLTEREFVVADLVSRGLSNKEIGNQLFITEKTVKFHLTNVYKKMSVNSRAQLIVFCLPHMGFNDNNLTSEQIYDKVVVQGKPAFLDFKNETDKK